MNVLTSIYKSEEIVVSKQVFGARKHFQTISSGVFGFDSGSSDSGFLEFDFTVFTLEPGSIFTVLGFFIFEMGTFYDDGDSFFEDVGSFTSELFFFFFDNGSFILDSLPDFFPLLFFFPFLLFLPRFFIA